MEPLGPVTGADDFAWFTLVKWVNFALVNADELGISSLAARGAYGGAMARGPAGNVVVRPGYRPPVPAGGWYRPPSYWRPGAAVAAGAALGFVTAAAATAYATSPAPAAGYYWYYTNSQRTQGFWDVLGEETCVLP